VIEISRFAMDRHRSYAIYLEISFLKSCWSFSFWREE